MLHGPLKTQSPKKLNDHTYTHYYSKVKERKASKRGARAQKKKEEEEEIARLDINSAFPLL